MHKLLKTCVPITLAMLIICTISGCDDDPTEKITQPVTIELLATSPENGGTILATGDLKIVFDSSPKSVMVDGIPAIILNNTAFVPIASLPDVTPGTEKAVIIEWRNLDNSVAGAKTITFTVLNPAADTPQTEVTGGETIQLTVDYAAEEAAIIEIFTLHAKAIGTKDPDEFMPYWLRSEGEDVFVVWDFWAGAFEKHLGWKAIKEGWEAIFRLRGGPMTVEIESVAIDKNGKNATLRGRYQWAVSGGFVASMVKRNRQDGWKIKQVDYTNEKFGKQVDELRDPAYMAQHVEPFNVKVGRVIPPRDDVLPPVATDVDVDPVPGVTVPPNQEFSLTFDEGVEAASVNGAAATGVGRHWSISPVLLEGVVTLNVTWRNRDGSSGAIALGPYVVRKSDVIPPVIVAGPVRNGDWNVDPAPLNAAGLRFDFSEPVTGTVRLTDEAGADLHWIATVAGRTATLTAVVGRELANETTYKVEIDVQDSSGNRRQTTMVFVTKPKLD